MNRKELLLVNRYAQAFFNHYRTDCDTHCFTLLPKAIVYFEHHKKLLFLLNLSLVTIAEKEHTIHQWCASQGLASSYEKLFMLLMQHQRIILIPHILKQIIFLCNKSYHSELFHIKSTVTLTDDQKKNLESFVEKQVGASSKYEYTLDASLIAGIRIESDTLLWENSVKNRLRILSHSLKN